MSDLTNKQFFPRTGVTETAGILRRPTAIVAGLLLTMTSLLPSCGGGGEQTSSTPVVAVTGETASLAWDKVPDSSVVGYLVHYGRQTPDLAGSCTYESFMGVTSNLATLTNLDPHTRYYFAVSVWNGLESACSIEVSTVTP